jgi:hypothetical protein
MCLAGAIITKIVELRALLLPTADRELAIDVGD